MDDQHPAEAPADGDRLGPGTQPDLTGSWGHLARAVDNAAGSSPPAAGRREGPSAAGCVALLLVPLVVTGVWVWPAAVAAVTLDVLVLRYVDSMAFITRFITWFTLTTSICEVVLALPHLPVVHGL